MIDSPSYPLMIHIQTSSYPFLEWGSLLKSDSQGRYLVTIAENVNRDDGGFIDLERMVGLDGTTLMNAVSNPREAILTGKKSLQSKISQDDGSSSCSFCRLSLPKILNIIGSTWKHLRPPQLDSLGRLYSCNGAVRSDVSHY